MSKLTNPQLFLPLIFLLLLLPQTPSSQNTTDTLNTTDLHNPLPLNVRVDGNITNKDPSMIVQNLRYYIVNITEILPDEDLILMVKPMNRNSDPDLFISFTNPFPNSYENSEKVCNAFGLDVCVVNSSQIAINSSFYVGISCYLDCEFYVMAEYNSEVFLQLGQEVIIRYYDTASEIAKFYIPEDETIDQLIIYANIMNSQEIKETFHLYVNEGNTIPSSSNYDYFSKEVWYDGKGVSISRSYVLPGIKPLKTNTNYTVLLEAPAGSVMVLIADAFPKIRNIKLFEQIRDLVDFQANQTYKLTISDEDLALMGSDPLIIEIKVFSGDPDLYVHYDTLPDSKELCQWKSLESGNEALSISKLERDQVNATSKVFFITVFGKFDSGYILNVYYTEKNEDFLLFGETMTGSILNGEIMNYRLNLFGSGDANVSLELRSETGNTEIFAKKCITLELNDCKIKKTDVENMQNLTESGIFHSNMLMGIDTVQFLFNHSECFFQVDTMQYGLINMCTYQIGIYGNSSNTEISHYSLLAKHSQKHVILKEDEAFRSQMDMNERNYYKFYVINSTNVQEVSFSVDVIAGDVSVYASRSNRYPNNTEHEKASYFELDYIRYTKEKDGDLSGTYYLTVEAFSSVDYIITPIIIRYGVNQQDSQNSSGKIKYTRLIEGETIKRSFTNRSLDHYFKVKMTFNESESIENRSILLNFKPISGKFKVFISVSDIDPSEKDHDYELIDNELMFDQISENSVKFKILVMVDPNSETQSRYSFELFYATSDAIIQLNFHPYYDTLAEDQLKYFKVNYDPQGPDLILTRTVYTALGSKSADVYVSLDENNPYPDERYNDYGLFNGDLNNNSSSLTIDHENLSVSCQKKLCTMFISVYAYQDLLFSLLVRQKITPILLADGALSKVPLPKANESLQFYYFVPDNETVTVFVDSFYISLKTFVNIKELSGNSDKASWDYPSEISYDFSYNTSYYSPGSIILKESLFEKCHAFTYGCALLITIARNTDYLIGEANVQDFDILITSEVTILQEGKPMIGYVDKHMIKYYSIFVSQKDCVLLLSVTPLGDGDPDIVVSKGKDARPTLEKYQWISNTYRSDQLQIGKGINDTMSGTYIVGVYGFTNTTFTITYLYEKQSLVMVRTGFPVELSLKEGEAQYLEYYNSHGEFRVILNKDYGSGLVLINAINGSLDFIEQMPNISKNSQWTTVNNNRDIAYISETDPGYCIFCNYVLEIYAQKDSKFQVIISNEIDPIHLQSGQPLNDYIDKDCKNHYFYQTNIETVSMSVLVYAGEIEIYISNNETVSESNYLLKLTKSDFKANKLDVILGKGFNLVPYLDENTSKTQSNDIYRHSILVKGVVETNFSISFSNAHERKVLRFGVADYAALAPKGFQEYLFYGSKDQIFSLLITVGNQAELSEFDTNVTSYELPTVEIKYKTKHEETLFPAKIIKTLTTSSSILYKIETVKGIYHINISNPNVEDDARYNLLVNSDDVELIIPGTETMQSLVEGGTKQYELYSPEPKKLFIEIFECLGKVELQGSQNYLKMKDGNYDWEFEYPYENNHIIAFYEVQAGPVFIGVTAIEGFANENDNSTKEEALYIMKTHLLPPKGKIPQEKFFAGGDGILNYKNSFMNNNLRVSFRGIECANKCLNETAYVPVEYLYYLHVSADQTVLTSFSRCNMNDDAFALFQMTRKNNSKLYYERYVQVYYGGSDHPEKINFDIELPEDMTGPFFINVVAEIWVYDNINNVFEQFTIVYNPQEVYNQKNKQTEVGGMRLLWILISVGGAVLFISLICCCYYRRRTKKFEKRLKYEMSDLRNVAGGEIFEDKKAGEKGDQMPIHYKGFLEEKGQVEE